MQTMEIVAQICIIAALKSSFGLSLPPKKPNECGTGELQLCLGGATEMAPDLYFHPLNADLLMDINDNLCGRGLENCMAKVSGNCSTSELAPYSTVASTINYVCQSDISNHAECITYPDAQHGYRFCFQIFKVVFDNVMADMSLSQNGIRTALCNAYNDVISCVVDVAESFCSAGGETYVENLVQAVSSANREVLRCS